MWKLFFAVALFVSSSLAQHPSLKLGVGIGIPYGVIGGNAEIGMSYVAVLGGFGYGLFAPGWSAGGRVYAAAPDKTWRPHATVVYGTTVVYQLKNAVGGAVVEEGALNGMGFYLGVDQDVSRPGGSIWTYGIGFITHESLPAGLKESDVGIPIKIMVGWNYRFGT